MSSFGHFFNYSFKFRLYAGKGCYIRRNYDAFIYPGV